MKMPREGWLTAVVGLYLFGANEILLLFAGAALVLMVYSIRRLAWKRTADLPFAIRV